MRIPVSFVLLLTAMFSLIAQDAPLDNTNHLSDIKTVILQKDIQIYDPSPILNLNSGERLKISFDQMKPTNEFFNYTYVHCDSKWQPSDLQQMEYINGRLMGDITDFKFSTNTYQKYTHYSLTFPQEGMELTKSGNYILKIYKNFDEEDVVLTRRFMIVDNQTRIEGSVKSATNAEYRFSHQEVDFDVNYEGFAIPNPFLDVNVTILQNNSWNNAIYSLKPLFVNGNVLNFNYEDKNLFPGTNEFRFFDIRSLRFFSNQVVKKYVDSVQNVVLSPDELRSHLNYVRWLDYNGKRDIINKDGVNIVEDGDYAKVHFYLKSKDKSDLGDIYIYGELSDWQLKEEFKMKYWPDYEMYSGSALLKQSYYNYHYVMKDKDGNLEYSFTEGNHQETENDYTILVYHKNQFYGYDELIGVYNRNSNTLSNK
ncbi:MAG: DUF5103 domain-containing protein [Bacteroidia bacterium]|nr:DUF5103 domain-containing protein [Bacteroidia bacterium]